MFFLASSFSFLILTLFFHLQIDCVQVPQESDGLWATMYLAAQVFRYAGTILDGREESGLRTEGKE
jgi:hypothetical protein